MHHDPTALRRCTVYIYLLYTVFCIQRHCVSLWAAQCRYIHHCKDFSYELTWWALHHLYCSEERTISSYEPHTTSLPALLCCKAWGASRWSIVQCGATMWAQCRQCKDVYVVRGVLIELLCSVGACWGLCTPSLVGCYVLAWGQPLWRVRGTRFISEALVFFFYFGFCCFKYQLNGLFQA